MPTAWKIVNKLKIKIYQELSEKSNKEKVKDFHGPRMSFQPIQSKEALSEKIPSAITVEEVKVSRRKKNFRQRPIKSFKKFKTLKASITAKGILKPRSTLRSNSINKKSMSRSQSKVTFNNKKMVIKFNPRSRIRKKVELLQWRGEEGVPGLLLSPFLEEEMRNKKWKFEWIIEIRNQEKKYLSLSFLIIY